MKPSYTHLKDDLQEIKIIQTKWRIQKREFEEKNEVKKLQLIAADELNPDFQLPDVFITTRQIHKSIKSPTPKRKKQCFSFDLSAQSVRQSKQERNLDIQTLETNYMKFKQVGCIFRESPVKSPLNQTSYDATKQTFYKLDGVNFPYNLYTMHQKRKEKLEDIYRNSTCLDSNQKIKEFEEQNVNQSTYSNYGELSKNKKKTDPKNMSVDPSQIMPTFQFYQLTKLAKQEQKGQFNHNFQENQDFINFEVIFLLYQKQMQNNSDNTTDFQEENKQIKARLLEYWVKVTKTLNDDYEEILNLGSESDTNDIVNALFIIEDARQEQIKTEKQQYENLQLQFQALQKKNQELQVQIDSSPPPNKNDSNQDIRQLEIRINELSLALVQSKEDKIIYMEQSQNEIQHLKAQELELRSQIQILQFEKQKKSSFADSEDDSKRRTKDFVDEDISRQSASPSTTKVKFDYSKVNLSQSLKKLTKIEQVQGSSQASYRFGNK